MTATTATTRARATSERAGCLGGIAAAAPDSAGAGRKLPAQDVVRLARGECHALANLSDATCLAYACALLGDRRPAGRLPTPRLDTSGQLRALRPGMALAWRARPRTRLPVVLEPGQWPADPPATGEPVSGARVGMRGEGSAARPPGLTGPPEPGCVRVARPQLPGS